MIVHVYENDEFVGKDDSEQRLVYFESTYHKDKEDYKFDEFIIDCMAKEMLIDSFYTLNLRTNLNETKRNVEKDYKDNLEKASQEEIEDMENMVNSLLINHNIKFPERILSAFCVYDHEWDYFFYILESDNAYYGYNWSTSL